MSSYGHTSRDVITDQRSAPVGNHLVDVFTSAADDEPVATVTTDERGRFGFELDDGPATVWVDDGFTDRRWPVAAIERLSQAGRAARAAHDDRRAAESSARAASRARRRAETSAAALAGRDGQLERAGEWMHEAGENSPNLEDLLVTSRVDQWITANGNEYAALDTDVAFGLITTPFPIEISTITMIWDKWQAPASSSNYWSVRIDQIHGDPDYDNWETLIEKKLDRMDQREPVRMDTDELEHRRVPQGAVIVANFKQTGEPEDMLLGISMTVQYQPL